MTKKKKSIWKSLDKTLLLRDFMVISFGVVVAFLFMFSFNMIVIRDSYFDKVVGDFSQEDYAQSLANVCSIKNGSFSRVMCVHRFFDWNYNPVVRRSMGLSPKEFMEKGGDCLESALFFCSVLENYPEVTCEIVQLPEHVTNVIYADGMVCNIDQREIQCYKIGGEN